MAVPGFTDGKYPCALATSNNAKLAIEKKRRTFFIALSYHYSANLALPIKPR